MATYSKISDDVLRREFLEFFIHKTLQLNWTNATIQNLHYIGRVYITFLYWKYTGKMCRVGKIEKL